MKKLVLKIANNGTKVEIGVIRLRKANGEEKI